MKQFIVLSAVLPILMIFVMQTAYDQKNSYAVNIIQDYVYAAKEEAKYEGEFTPEIKERLRKNISRSIGVDANEIHISSHEEGGIIYYRVEAPIKGVAAGNRLLGIKDEDNQYKYVIDSYTKGKGQ
jgi:hypothetical protein